jgi:hypothetical protein
VFKGTRVPVKTLFDYLEDNYSLDEFLECFPSVTRAMACQLVTSESDEDGSAAKAGLWLKIGVDADRLGCFRFAAFRLPLFYPGNPVIRG